MVIEASRSEPEHAEVSVTNLSANPTDLDVGRALEEIPQRQFFAPTEGGGRPLHSGAVGATRVGPDRARDRRLSAIRWRRIEDRSSLPWDDQKNQNGRMESAKRLTAFGGDPRVFHRHSPPRPARPGTDPARVAGASVTFEPAPAPAWHMHPLGQHLIVTSGFGLAQRWAGVERSGRGRGLDSAG